MRNLISPIILLLACCSSTMSYAQHPENSSSDSFEQLLNQFHDPGKAYGSAPLWVWNADVSEGKIDSMLQAFKGNAFGGVFVHPRPGLVTPYLSDRWFELYQYTVQKGKELDLDVWIYDENSYPSGFAGGHVPQEMPSSYNQGQMLHLEKANRIPLNDTSLFLVLEKKGDGFAAVDLNASTHPEEDYYLFRKDYYQKSPWYGGYSYVDLMAKGVTEKFIEVTMSGYEKTLGHEFGKTIPGIFTDEPNIEVQGANNIRWTPDLFAIFQQTWGYELQANLPSLFEEVGDWKKVRHNYYQVLLQLFIDRWSKPWYNYTNEKHLEWTGHYWEHGWPNPNHGGDNMAMYAWHQRPAIDMLFNQFDEESPNAQFGNIRAVKELASVANQLGRKRTLSETYGGGGWELRFQDMKRLGDWQYVLGVNTLNQHLAYMTMVGARKYDYPQSFSYHSPWWPYYKPLNEYFTRLSLALSTGEQINEILILEPTTSTWMYSTYQDASSRRQEIGQAFQSFVTQLEKAQVEYDLGSENIIKDQGAVQGAKFIVGKRAYSRVIIPPGMENLDGKTADLLASFVKNGGELVVLEDLQYVDGATAAAKLQPLQTHRKALTDFSADAFKAGDISFSSSDTLAKLYHQRRVLADGELLFLVNASLEASARGNIEVQGKNVYLLDLMDGQRYKYPVTAAGIAYDLPAAGSQLFFISEADYPEIPLWEEDVAENGKLVETATQVDFLEPNVLTLDFCDVQIGDTLVKDQQVFHASDTIFKHFGFVDGNPWNTSVQYKDNTIRRDTFSTADNFKVDYYFRIKAGVPAKSLEAVVERPWLWDVYLNDKLIRPNKGSWYLDKDFGVFAIGNGLRNGENKLSLVAKKMRVHAEVEPVYILGDFGLQSAAKGWELVASSPAKIGTWKAIGRPMYGQQASYSKIFQAAKGKSYKIKLAEWAGTAAVVKVNGQLIGDISLAPFELTLDEELKNGENKVEVIVVGSLKNTLGPHHNQPKPGMVSPWHWRGVENYPAGSAYDLYDYGLLEDFQLIELNKN